MQGAVGHAPRLPPPLLKSATLKSVHILLQCNGCACRVKYPFQGIKDVEEQLARGGVSDCCKCIYEEHCKCGRGHIKNAGSNKHAKAYCKPCDCPCGHTTKHDRKGYKCNPCSCEQQNKCQCHDDHGRVYCCECGSCFPSTARVSLENGKSLTMSELQTGDRVQTGTGPFIVFN